MITNLSDRTVDGAAPVVAVLSGTNIDNQVDEKYKLDRYITDIISLPYNYNDVKIDYDTFVTNETVNDKIQLLHDNFLFLNAQSKLAVNDMPLDGVWEGSLGVNSAPFTYQFNSPSNNTKAVTQAAAAGGTSLSGFTDAAFTNDKDQTRFVGFVPTDDGSRLLALEVEHTTSSPYITGGRAPVERFTGTGITTLEAQTELSFTNILDVEISKADKLYVLDNNLIHKLNVESVLTHSSALSGVGRFLEKSIGGTTSSNTINTKFKNAVKIALDSQENVYVLDTSLSGYKVFDKNLNWKSNNIIQSKFKELEGDLYVDINVDKNTGNIYLLSREGKMSTYDTDGKFLETTTFSDKVSGETFKTITFSEINNNIFYVLTDQNLYKRFVSRPERSIGSYKTDNILNLPAVSGTESFSFFSAASGIADRETLFLGSETLNANYAPPVTNATVGKIFVEPFEKTNYKTLVYDLYKTQAYDLSSTEINMNEYVSAFMLNKALYKLLYNHMIFNDHIHSKFTAQYQVNGQAQLTDISYIEDNQTNILNLSAEQDYFVGINEPCIASVVNRCIKKIHDLQLEIASNLQTKFTNKYPLVEQTVELS